MKEIFGNIWDLAIDNDANAIVITTNGVVKQNGEAVMGRGIAKEVAERHPEFAKRLGFRVNEIGNVPFVLEFINSSFEDGSMREVFFTLPVKHNWWEKADPYLIVSSIKKLVALVDADETMKVILVPRPGCGNGGLKWKDVKPIIEPYLDDRFYICHKES